MRRTICICSIAGALACSDSGGNELGAISPDAILPAQLDFGEVPLGTSRRLQLEIRNVGAGRLIVSDIVLDADFATDNYRFSVDTDGFEVLPGNSETLDVDFTPLADEERSEQTGFTIEWNQPMPGRVELVGRGVGARLELDPPIVDFGPVLWGSSRAIDVTITSRHDVPVDVFTRLNGQGEPLVELIDGTGQFSLLSSPDPRGALTPSDAPLVPDASFDVTLEYRAEVGEDTVRDVGRWTVATCAPAVCGEALPLRATPRPDAFDCEPAVLDFGGVQPGERIVQTSTCTNVVSEAVDLGTIMLETGPEGYSIERAPSSRTIDVGQSFSVDVGFSPPAFAVGNTLERNLVIAHAKVGGASVGPTRLALTGRAGRPVIELSNDDYAFAETVISTSARRALTVFNRGQSLLSLSISRFGPFRAAQEDLQVPPDSSATTEIVFSPTDSALFAGRLEVTSNDPRQPELSIAVSGQGSALPPCSYSLEPAELAFGLTAVGETVTEEVMISNPGPGPCLVNDVRLEGDSALSILDGPSGRHPLPAATSTVVVVAFSPTEDRSSSGQLQMYVSSIDASSPRIPVSGQGTIDPLIITPNPIVIGARNDCVEPAIDVSIINPFPASETILGVAVEGQGFSAEDAPNPPRFLLEGQSVTFRVRAPASGPARGTLVVTTAERPSAYRVPLLRQNEDTRIARFENASSALDVLFVVGDDRRFTNLGNELSMAAQQMVTELDAGGIDYRLGVVRGRVSAAECSTPPPASRPFSIEQGLCGYLADGGANGANASWRVVTPQTVPAASSALMVTLAQPFRNDIFFIEAFHAVRRALTPPLSTGWNAPFRRPDAPLAVVVISAIDDAGRDIESGPLLEILRAQGPGPVVMTTVTAPRTGTCFRDPVFASPSPRLIDAADQSGGAAIVICDVDWPTQVMQEGLPLVGRRRNFTVSPPAEPASFIVRVDGTAVPALDPTGQSVWTGSQDGVVFREPPAAASVELEYRTACR